MDNYQNNQNNNNAPLQNGNAFVSETPTDPELIAQQATARKRLFFVFLILSLILFGLLVFEIVELLVSI